MTMPWQLREGLKRRVKGAPARPIIEKTSCISVNDLNIPSQNDPKTYILPNISLKYPWLAAARLSCEAIELVQPSLHRGGEGITQQFGIKHIRTGIGKAGYGIRHSFLCDCGEPVIKLYLVNRRVACRYCHCLRYASEVLGKRTRPLLQISRINSFLNNRQRLLRRTKERLRQKLGDQVMLAQNRLNTDAQSLLD